jgi:D-3-phosphoglycerate dehydrogenase
MPKSVVVADQKAADLTVERKLLDEVGLQFVDSGGDLGDVASEANVLITDGYTRVSTDLIDRLPELKAVVRAGIGVDNIDVEAATEKGVYVVNVPDPFTEEVAVHALTLYLCIVRNIQTYDSCVREGEWNWEMGRPVPRLSNQTVGLVGFGSIAKTLARKARGFDFDLVAYSPRTPAAEMVDHGVEKVDFSVLLERADAVSIHAPLTQETARLFDAEAFAVMKDSAVFVNTARGDIVDEDALNDVLAADELRGAGLIPSQRNPRVRRRCLTAPA